MNLAHVLRTVLSITISLTVFQVDAHCVHNLTNDYETTLYTTTQALLTILRDKTTSYKQFRKATKKLAHLLAHEAASLLPTNIISIETPCAQTTGISTTKNVILIPIWRSGLALLPAFLDHFEEAVVGFIGLRRDEVTAHAECYYCNIPPVNSESWVIILDPMLATGGSCHATLERIINMGAQEEKIVFVGVVGAHEGITKIHDSYPRITIILAAEDPLLNEKKFIVPGLGDFGDRYFGTDN